MTNSDRPKRPNQQARPTRRASRSASPERESVPRAYDELQRERELYSAHNPERDPEIPTPAQKWNEAHNSWHGWQGTGSIPATNTARSAGTTPGTNTPYHTGATGAVKARRTNPNAERITIDASDNNASDKAPAAQGRTSAPYNTAGQGTGSFNRAGAARNTATTNNNSGAYTGYTPQANAPANTTGGFYAAANRDPGKAHAANSASAGATGTTETVGTTGAFGATGTTGAFSAATDDNGATNAAAPNAQAHASNGNSSPNGAKQQSAQTSASPTPHKSTTRASATYGTTSRYQSRRITNTARQTRFTRTGLIAALVVVVVAVIGVFAFQNYEATKAIAVTLNGETVTVEGDQRSPEGILDAGLATVTPGNYIAVDNSVIRKGEGTRATVTLNGEKTDDLSTHLEEGDEVTLEDGTDVMESFTEGETEVLPYSTKITGTGAIHLYINEGKNGEKVTRTGDESGITTEVVTQEPVDRTVQYYNADTGGDKVIALTFDDGPWDTYTKEILDILDENDAKATFFTVGSKISGHEDLVKRAAEAGHEIGTHTWDHAEGSGKGVSLIKMSSDECKEEVTKGLKAIKDATGEKASTIFRAPGGNFDESVATDLQELVSAEIGWNIDTNDWQRPGASTIQKRIESAGAGNIVLMHDGGGDRSQTVEALKAALPNLKKEGYSFITVQELIEKYPYKES